MSELRELLAAWQQETDPGLAVIGPRLDALWSGPESIEDVLAQWHAFRPPAEWIHRLIPRLPDDKLLVLVGITAGPFHAMLLDEAARRPATRANAISVRIMEGYVPSSPDELYEYARLVLDGADGAGGGLVSMFDAERALRWAERLTPEQRRRLLEDLHDPVGRELLGVPGTAVRDLYVKAFREEWAEQPDHDRGAGEPIHYLAVKLSSAPAILKAAAGAALDQLEREGEALLVREARSRFSP